MPLGPCSVPDAPKYLALNPSCQVCVAAGMQRSQGSGGACTGRMDERARGRHARRWPPVAGSRPAAHPGAIAWRIGRDDPRAARRAPTSTVTVRTAGRWRARRDSNSRPLGPQPNALSTELRAHAVRHGSARTRRSVPRPCRRPPPGLQLCDDRFAQVGGDGELLEIAAEEHRQHDADAILPDVVGERDDRDRRGCPPTRTMDRRQSRDIVIRPGAASRGCSPGPREGSPRASSLRAAGRGRS